MTRLLTGNTVFAGEEGDESDVRANVTGATGDQDPRLLGRHLAVLCLGRGVWDVMVGKKARLAITSGTFKFEYAKYANVGRRQD